MGRLSRGELLGDYEIVAFAGSGPNGDVYRARQRSLGRIIALKVIREELAGNTYYRDELLEKARLAASLDHPHLAPVYEAGHSEGQLFLAREWIYGEDLGQLIAASGRLRPWRVIALARQLAEALDAAHAVFVHGAVKPANVFVRDLEGVGDIELSDFGVSAACVGATSGGAVSPYLAPEVIRGDEPSTRSDLYALGCIVFEALTGHAPLITADARQGREPAAPPASSLVNDLEPVYDDVLSVALSSDPEHRFASGEEFVAALLQAGEALGSTGVDVSPVVEGDYVPAAPKDDRAGEQNVFDDDVQFTVYRPRRAAPERWHTVLVFAHKTEPFVDETAGPIDPLEAVRQQAAARLGEDVHDYGPTSEDSPQQLPHGSTLTFVPEAEGVQFNPPSRSFRWLEPVHQEEFRMRAEPRLEGTRARGRVSVYLGSILIAEVGLSFRVSRGEEAPAPTTERARPYRRIFISYSHSDAAVVDQVEQVAMTYGDNFLRDVRDLRAGEHWDERICELIRQADIFQLFWSRNSMASTFVRREWMYALGLQRPYFIRPVFWERPMPELPEQNLPPEELKRLQFRYLPGLTGDPDGVEAAASPLATAATPPPRAHPVDGPTSAGRAVPSAPLAPAPAGPSASPPSAHAGGARLRGLLRNPALATVLIALVIGAPLAVLGLSKLNTGSSARSSSKPTSTVTTVSGSEPANTGPATTGSVTTGPPTNGAPSCAGCQALTPVPCLGCLGWQGNGSADLGAVTGSRLTWTSQGGPFELVLDGQVAASSSAPTGEVQLPDHSYSDVQIVDPGSWSIKLY